MFSCPYAIALRPGGGEGTLLRFPFHMQSPSRMTEVAVRTPLQRRRAAGRRVLSLLLWLLTLLLVLCQATIWYGPLSPLPAALDQLAVQLAELAVIVALLALMLRRWFRLAVLIALIATFSWPIVAHRGEAAVVTEPARLEILSANVWHAASGQIGRASCRERV